ncbi:MULTISPECIES: DUF2309 domain-containing protein [Cryobacterium]|uniref:Probable inorganic carbon transporter subunit DabA n=1 Tax=Cryobacterium breve TaxID=1259258 RepID=A0ABY2IYZ4_9MICO|nr:MULTISPECIES: DUF2309 domain-containing protein [Cryobacterium]TFC93108.1 DUF2309 domain-containing protein [Cryobacterium sp. TmT3-12]TFC96093.1 DUF2309 domain-containing protein [Cryobacterium breve]
MNLILRAQVATAAHDIVPSWPMESFIAVNPLAGHEPRPFETAAAPGVVLARSRDAYLADADRGRIVDTDLEAALAERVPELAGQLTIGGKSVSAVSVAILDMRITPWTSPVAAAPTAPWLDEYLAIWVSSYLNPDPLWAMPHKQHGFYQAWRTLARRDPSLPRTVRRTVAELPVEPDAALAWALVKLGVPADAVTETLRSELHHLPGWVGHIKWRAERIGDIDLLSYLGVRLTLRALLGLTRLTAPPGPTQADVTPPALWHRAEHVARSIGGGRADRDDIAAVSRILATHPVPDHALTWQQAYELHYRAALVDGLRDTDPFTPRPQLQLVMCIDPRSEGMRRHVEVLPEVETFGFAGFFGVPVRFSRYKARGAINSLPALLTARHHLTEHPTHSAQAENHTMRGRARDALRRSTHRADSGTVTPFAFAEVSGWLFGAISVLRTLTPTLQARIHRFLTPATATLPSNVTVADAFTLEERAAMAETAVRMMGITQFAPLVVLAGHASESMNNLYQSALDCGACGGNPGAANARASAAIFNAPDVRVLLAARGIDIPSDSFFIAAEHNTVTDAVTLLDQHLIPQSHVDAVHTFNRAQHTAAEILIRERAQDLPGASPHSPSRVQRRAHDWAEVYPELGLAGNAAMVIGPRRMTRGVNLDRRVFLHSYQTELDLDGAALETIMTAPLVVAQWINHQYYFSALNPATLGAGTKTIHNAVGTIGVLAGHTGDLRRGLPWQSVGLGDQLFHEPMRLTVIIQAPLDSIGRIVSRNQVLRNLLDNSWITLTARNDSAAPWHRYTPYGWTAAPTALKGT